jgi:hypothetical protein
MKRVFPTAAIVVSICLAVPAPLRAEEPSNTMVSTNWSLEKAGKTKPRRQTAQNAGGAQHTVRSEPAKPRVFGGATVSNRGKRNQGKARAQVGVALPF